MSTLAIETPSKPRRRPSLLAVAPIVIGALGIGLLLVLVSPSALATSLSSFDLRFVPLLLALAVADYAVRFLRWRWLVTASTETKPPVVADLACFLGANTLLLTPMRAGDFSRSAYAQALFGTPASQTAPVPLLERIADVVLIALIAALGTLAFGISPLLAVAGCALALMAIVSLRSLRLRGLGIALLRRTAGPSMADHAATFFESLDALWRPRPLLIAFGLGAVAWLLECVAFFVVLWGLGLPPSAELAGQSSFIYPVANLAGSLSLLPGGIGVAEGSVVGLTRSLVSVETATALAAGLLIRAAIVGFGVVSGLPGLVYVTKRMANH